MIERDLMIHISKCTNIVLAIILMILLALFLLLFSHDNKNKKLLQKSKSSTTKQPTHYPPKSIPLHTPSFPSSFTIQSFPLGTFKQPALTSDQTPAQHGNSFLSPLFLSTHFPDRDQIQQCLHALSHHGVFHWQFLHVFPNNMPIKGT